jgi:hypothetical protein
LIGTNHDVWNRSMKRAQLSYYLPIQKRPVKIFETCSMISGVGRDHIPVGFLKRRSTIERFSFFVRRSVSWASLVGESELDVNFLVQSGDSKRESCGTSQQQNMLAS